MERIKIIIAPRHPDRANSILSIYKKSGIKAKIIVNDEEITEDLIVINSFGNLGKYFHISDIVFLGGSFVNKGGHNPIEPAINNCVVVAGPQVYNWQNIYDDMKENNACIISDDILDFEKTLTDLLNNNEKMNNLKLKSELFAKKNFFQSNKLIDSIKFLIEKT